MLFSTTGGSTYPLPSDSISHPSFFFFPSPLSCLRSQFFEWCVLLSGSSCRLQFVQHVPIPLLHTLQRPPPCLHSPLHIWPAQGPSTFFSFLPCTNFSTCVCVCVHAVEWMIHLWVSFHCFPLGHKNARARTLSTATCVSWDRMQGEDGGGGEMRLILTEKAGIHSAGTEQARKECRSDMREREGGGGTPGAVSTLRERMFFACLPVAAWERGRQQRRDFNSAGLDPFCFPSASSSFSFCPRPRPSFLSACHLLLFSFLGLQRDASASISILFLVCSGNSESFLLSAIEVSFSFVCLFYWSDKVLFIMKLLHCCESYTECLSVLCICVCVRTQRPAVRFYHACLVFEFYCLSGLLRGCAHTALVCTVCIVAVTVWGRLISSEWSNLYQARTLRW